MLHSLSNIRLSRELREEVRKNIRKMSEPSSSFYIMVALSAIIAAYGLLLDNAAVVIGSMLVAPLMGPIFGIALSLSSGERRLLRHSLFSEFFGILISVGLGWLIGLLPSLSGFGSQILSRTQPTIYDLIVALAAGSAGAYAIVDPVVSPSLPGVAVAISLVPPLAVCGLTLSSGRWDLALGAFLLFFANFVAIELASAAVFIALGLVEWWQIDEALTVKHFIKRFGISILSLLVIGAFLTNTLLGLIRKRNELSEARRIVSGAIDSIYGARLSGLQFETGGKTPEIVVTVLTPSEFSPEQVGYMQSVLQTRLKEPIHLIVRNLISKDVDRNGPVFVPETKVAQRKEAERRAATLSEISRILTRQMREIPGAGLLEFQAKEEGNLMRITAASVSPSTITPRRVAKIQAALREVLKMPVKLVVRSASIKVADDSQYLYQPRIESVVEPALHQRLSSAIAREISKVNGATLTGLMYLWQNKRLFILAKVRSPGQIIPEQVKKIEHNLRKYVLPRIDLVVYTNVGAYATDTGYLPDLNETNLKP